MSIRRFFDQDIIVRRLRLGSGKQRHFQATATVEGHIQELDQRARQELGILEEKGLEAWFPEDAPIQEGDFIDDADGVRYEVREVIVKDYGINQHMQVILIQHNE